MADHIDGADCDVAAGSTGGRRHLTLGSILAVAVLTALGVVGSAATQLASSSAAPPQTPSAGHQRMLALLQQLADETPTLPYIGDRLARQLRKQLNALPATNTGTKDTDQNKVTNS